MCLQLRNLSSESQDPRPRLRRHRATLRVHESATGIRPASFPTRSISKLVNAFRATSRGSRPTEPSDEEDDSGEEEEGDDEYEPNASQTPPSTTKKGKKSAIRKYRVTEEDIESMVQYIVDKRKRSKGWDHLSSLLPWEEFAARPEVRPVSSHRFSLR